MTDNHPVLIWLDLEMTGLDAKNDRIIELAALVTDGNLDIIAEGPNLVIHQPDDVLNSMDEWNTSHHGASGLTDRVRASTLSTEAAEQQVLEFLRDHCGKGEAPLVGNSIHHDRWFLKEHMPTLEDYLHYRIIDISSVKELGRRWYPDAFANKPAKKEAHRALDDILESVAELRYWREAIFK